ncbi:signal recognition particle-docking protein FtsY [Antrihabitans sp. YC3-6]|uniref:Signal recognition particle receptor FtsY n=1 Tax=Antrihabitans stalagmiti TaxID=2799499 RepID=A0A934NVT3_9NOCA|nr:signal recognition particle-docking protein FtsY [Antrihabitans stalagmiti]MBJ8342205.1 signal recognition particle-docking protein FtsY [Antrihabitans stalagmiti]
MTAEAWILIAAAAAILLIALVVGFVLYRRRQISLTATKAPTAVEDRSGGYKAGGGFSFSQGGTATAPRQPVGERTDVDGQPGVGDDAAVPRDAPKRGITEIRLPDPVVDEATPVAEKSAPAVDKPAPVASEPAVSEPVVEDRAVEEPLVEEPKLPTAPATPQSLDTAPTIDEIAPTEGRLDRLRGRLSRSQSAVGKSLLGLLGGGDLDEDSWEEVEDTLLIADLGSAVTTTVVAALRERMATRNVRTEAEVRALLREVLIEALHPELDRSIRALPHDDHPSILLVVGVNGTGKTTTTGKLARVLVADGRRVLLGAADTFRAAAADQLQTWGERVGADTVRGKEHADPASVAFDAVSKGIELGVDVVLIDTAGRLHTKTGLMDELGKVKRVIEKRATVDEVLLVLDATIGQNGLMQARVFADVVAISGVVLTKLDGTAKGGIVFQVQHELGVPVKLVGLGEGADDLAPFEPAAFVDALLG